MKIITKNNMLKDNKMNYSYNNFSSKKGLIDGVVLRKLTMHKDNTGTLFETLRTDWQDVFSANDLSFAMQYMSITPSGIARDEDMWHVHKFQNDRFICVSGKIITAVYDPRQNSHTKGTLNLFAMGPEIEDEMYMVVIPKETYHGFMVISKEPGYLLNFPTKLYNPQDEGRVKNNEELKWQKVRKDFGLGS